MGRWAVLLRFLGGAGLVAMFFVDHVRFDDSRSFSPFGIVKDGLENALVYSSGAENVQTWATVGILLLPHLFGLFIALDTLRTALSHRSPGLIYRGFCRALPLMWLLSSGLLLISPRPHFSSVRALCMTNIGLVLLGLVVLPRWWSRRDHAGLVRRVRILGALLCVVWWVFVLVFHEACLPPIVGLSLAASAAVLVGSLPATRK
jgi:hypothetical protein